MKDYDENNEPSYLKYWNSYDLRGWVMSQKLPVDGFKWVKNTSHLNKDFIKNYDEDSYEVYFVKADVQYTENYMKQWKTKKLENPQLSCMIKKNMWCV